MRFVVVPIGFAVGIAFLAAAFLIFWPLAIVALWLDLIFLVSYLDWSRQFAQSRQRLPAQAPSLAVAARARLTRWLGGWSFP